MSPLGWALTCGAGVVGAVTAQRLCLALSGRPPSISDRGFSAAPARRRPPTGPVLLVALASATAIGITTAVMVAVAMAAGWIALRHRAEARQRQERDGAVPELVDLFVLAATAGLPVASALPIVGERAPLPVRPVMADAIGRMALGGSAAHTLDQLRAALGPPAGPLLDALDSAARLGTPLGPALTAVSIAAHQHRSQAAEEAARRLPVTLLFPLAACILPAAVLLAVVPVLVASLGSLAG